MTPAMALEVSRIAPLDLDHAHDVYAARLTRMSDEQLTEERHRLEAQWPLGEAHRLANAEFEKRNPVAEMAPTTRWGDRAMNDQECRNCGRPIFWGSRNSWVHRDAPLPSVTDGAEGCITIYPGRVAIPVAVGEVAS